MGNESKWPSLLYKIFYLAFYAGYMPFLLFLPVYLKYIGLTAIQVGIIAGLRPVLQSIGTPLLVAVAEKFHSRRMIFIISCLVLIIKVLIIFLFFRPSHQLCHIKYTNITDQSVKETFHVVEHKLTKRSVRQVTQEWLKHKTRNLNSSVTSIPPRQIQTSNSTNNTTLVQNHNGTANVSSYFRNSTTHTSARPPQTKNTMIEHNVINDKTEVYRIFVGLVILGLLGDWFESTIFTLIDHSCTANLRHEDFGLTRLWGNVGWGVMTPVIGGIIYYFHVVICDETVGSFHYAFLFTIGFANIAVLVGSHVDFASVPTDEITNKVHDALSNFRYGLFLFASSFSGFCNGFLFTFSNWFIDGLGGNALIMGISTFCKCVVDFALFFLLQGIIDRFGYMYTMSTGFLGYILVFFVYFTIRNPWLVVIAEIIHAMVYALITSTSVSFLIFKAPAGSSPKMQAILQGIYWGFGTGCGAMFGGYCLHHVGFRQTFVAFAIITCIVASVFFVIQLTLYTGEKDMEDTSQNSSDFDGDDEEESSYDESEHSNDGDYRNGKVE